MKRLVRSVSGFLAATMMAEVVFFASLNINAATQGTLDFVTRCYEIALGREPEESGLQEWARMLTDGEACGVSVAYGFVYSPEFQNNNYDNATYTEKMYNMLLGRESDSEGKNYWVEKLDNGESKEDIFYGFSNSQEFYNLCESYEIFAGHYVYGIGMERNSDINCFVNRFYEVCLGRRGDIGGQASWVEQLADGSLSGTALALGFIFSPEYIEKNTSNEEYVKTLYTTFLGREADKEGLKGWTEVLDNGTKSREEVFNGFCGSVEFDALCKKYGIERGVGIAGSTYTPITPGSNTTTTPIATPTGNVGGTTSTPGSNPTKTPTVTPTGSVSGTPSATSSVTPTVTPTGSISGTPSVTPTATPSITPEVVLDVETDTDGDGIPDDYEKLIGTNSNSADTDGDGIEDGIEIQFGLDPMSVDSDGNGIPDGEEDDDGDGLTFLQESTLGTITWTNDSDVDGISDYDEVNRYGTDPLNNDSDNDGINDGDEFKLGTDPLVSDSDGDGVSDGSERFLQTREEILEDEDLPLIDKVEVTLEGTGCLDSAMKVRSVYGIDTYSSDLVGLAGVPVEFEYEGEFDEATLTFHYDEDSLASNKPNIPEEMPIDENYRTNPENLGIFYYDEETGLYIDCGATVDTVNKTVSCKTTHFSIYMVVDTYIWGEWLKVSLLFGDTVPSHEDYQGIDYVLEIPCVDSMTAADIAEMNEIVYQIVDNMRTGDQMVLRGYNEAGVYSLPYYQTDKEVLKASVENWPWNEGDNWYGYTNYSPYPEIIRSPYGLDGGEIFNIAISSNDNGHNPNNELVAIAFNNSEDISCPVSVIESHRAKYDMSAYIFTLSSGNPNTTNMNCLDLISGGGVIDCEGKTAEEVYAEFSMLYAFRQYPDADEDNLSDYDEVHGMIGSNGKLYHSDPTVKDSDDDGLTDKEEMGGYYELYEDGSIYCDGKKVTISNPIMSSLIVDTIKKHCKYGKVHFYGVKSNPQKKDSDNDDALDYEDATPLKKNAKACYILYGPSEDFEDFENQVNYCINKYEDDDRIAFSIPVSRRKDFLNCWNSMGCDSDGKICYRLDEVLIICHGHNMAEEFMIGLGTKAYHESGEDLYVPNELDLKKINVLTIESCYSGTKRDGKVCLVELFMESNHDIGTAIGWDGQVKFNDGPLPFFSFWSMEWVSVGESYSGEPFFYDYEGKVTYRKNSDGEIYKVDD